MKTNASSLASVLALLALSASRAAAQLPVPVGAGSYASFPPAGEGTGVADMLTRTIYVTDPNRPIPTNDWWTDLDRKSVV